MARFDNIAGHITGIMMPRWVEDKRFCPGCEKYLDPSEFGFNRGKYRSQCRMCEAKRNRIRKGRTNVPESNCHTKRREREQSDGIKFKDRDCTQCVNYPCFQGMQNVHKHTTFASQGCVYFALKLKKV